jgi:hypothetical protein
MSPPRGWSYQSYMARRPADIETRIMQRGLVELHHGAPQVELDYGSLLPLQRVLIDDKRIDVRCWVRVGGSIQLVEVDSLWAMDLATRRILWVQLFPCYKRDDGSTVGIAQREVSHFLAAMLMAHGVPDYGMQIVHENASAKPGEGMAETLARATDGRVNLRATGLWDGRDTVGGFAQSGGTPRGKAPLESYFGHRLDVALGACRGQMGSRYQLTHGDMARRLQEARQIGGLAPVATDEELTLLMPVEGLAELQTTLLREMRRLEERTDHDLVGFAQLDLWRYAESDPVWRRMDSPDMLSLLGSIGDVGVNALLSRPGCSMSTMESPLMRWERLYDSTRISRLSDAACMDLWRDTRTLTYEGLHRLRVTGARGAEYEFRGRAHTLEAGDVCQVVYDGDTPALGCILLDSRGRHAGRMEWVPRVDALDSSAIAARMEEQAKAKARVMTAVRMRHTGPTAEELEDKTRILTTLGDRATGRMLESAGSELVAGAMAGAEAPAAPERPSAARSRDIAQATSASLARQEARLTTAATAPDLSHLL